MIIWDQARLVLAALSQKIPLPTFVEIVEVMATRRALLFAKELGFERVMVEGDSEVIIKDQGESITFLGRRSHFSGYPCFLVFF